MLAVHLNLPLKLTKEFTESKLFYAEFNWPVIENNTCNLERNQSI